VLMERCLVLDPVMGDAGHLYIPEEIVPVYKSILRYADLILPNQFEAEILSDIKITNLATLATAIQTLHHSYQIPHIVITSLRLSKYSDKMLPSTSTGSAAGSPDEEEAMTVIGSTSTSGHSPRLWRINIPAYPVFFSGTGDMFAALMVARLREAVYAAELQNTASWKSPDDVPATELPLAKAAVKVLASMQAVLGKTYEAYTAALPGIQALEDRPGQTTGEDGEKNKEKKSHLRRTKAAEVRVVRNVRDLIDPPDMEKYRAQAVDVKFANGEKDLQPDELGVVNLGVGGHGAVHTNNDSRWGP
jgi:pyridoxine kinase